MSFEPTYTFLQWLVLFYFYCFFGWCFESSYVSIRKKKLVNRGFMKGPFLPLYGFGAITVLFSSLPFRENPWLVYIVGALAATVLEYVTGVIMEALFRVRYWDYSDQKFNFQGHICVTSTAAWGMLSLLMVYAINKPVEHLIFMIPNEWLIVPVILISVIVVSDFAVSFKTAIDLRDVLIKAEKIKIDMRALQKRVDALEKLILEEKEQKLEWLKEELLEIREKQAVYRAKLEVQFSRDKYRLLLRHPSAISKKYAGILEDIKEKFERR